MFVKRFASGILLTVVLSVPISAAHKKEDSAGIKTVVLWRDPVDIRSRNLFYGPGGKAHQPNGRFVFVKEDLGGTNPKFDIRDEDGVRWKVKMGNEARPETVATRITWAVGYSADEDYFVPCLQVQGMPAYLHRGQKLVGRDGSVRDVRLKREETKKIGTWDWRQDAFANTRELNGLRVLMALINNWDLKDENNGIYHEDAKYVYVVNDLGASFGSASRTWPRSRSKGDLDSYQHSKFLTKVTDTTVSFRTPARPSFVFLVNPKEYFQRIHLEWIGKDIPRNDARWMGRVLARLSPNQIRDAFRAAGYSSTQVEAFASIMETRIALLTDL
jgi:hypothetical protein